MFHHMGSHTFTNGAPHEVEVTCQRARIRRCADGRRRRAERSHGATKTIPGMIRFDYPVENAQSEKLSDHFLVRDMDGNTLHLVLATVEWVLHFLVAVIS